MAFKKGCATASRISAASAVARSDTWVAEADWMPSGSDAATTIRLATPSAVLGGFRGLVPSEATPPRRVGAFTSLEEQYLSDVYQYAHPSVTDSRLVELGYLTCRVRCGGSSSDDAKVAVWTNLNAAGVVSSSAEMGSLVHVAVDTLCPEVGYP